jgi:nicotinate-nucleotide--dimethylbenzimidazole phosphoribosyltransferase
MMANLAGGGAAACVLARALGVGLEVVDVGVAADLSGLAGIRHAKVRPGTASFTQRSAMSTAECHAAIEAGRAAASRAATDGCRALAVGDMGIGNTTAAAALASAFTGATPERTVGRGTGVDDRTLARKRAVVTRALALHAAPGRSPEELLAALGGLEIAAIAGAVMEAAARGLVVVLDGYISSTAGLVAVRMKPDCRAACVLSHRSAEPGHALVLEALGGEPLLDLGMRLGEGTGAVLAVPLLRAAAAVLREMATFESAGISGPA